MNFLVTLPKRLFKKSLRILVSVGMALVGTAATAQEKAVSQGSFYFEKGHNFCDTAAWKPVFEETFTADTVPAPWITFTSWASMPGGDHENWSGARENGLGTYRAKNVFVKDGFAHLQARKEADAWRCDTCMAPPKKTAYTTAILALPYTRFFHSGRFEARLKMPRFKWAHSTFWTWFGNHTNEIDIAEGYGYSKNYLRWATRGKTYVNYSLHNWPTRQAEEKGAAHYEARNHYPRQGSLRSRKRLQIDAFHVYACEWDTAVVRFYLDGELVNELWKYSQNGRGSGCVAAGGEYDSLPAFPSNNQSFSNLRFTLAVDRADRRHKEGLLGELVIDYVRIWQRHPEQDSL